jgi:hypothetical protein
VPKNETTRPVGLEADDNVAMVLHPVGIKGSFISRKDANALVAADKMRTMRNAPGGQARLCADGDSWINILWPFSAAAGYQPTFFDILEERYYAANVAYPGDTFSRMRAEKDYHSLVDSESFDFFIFSGGGNDFLGGGALSILLKDRKTTRGSRPANFINRPQLTAALDKLEAGYREIAADVKRLTPQKKTRMLVHGYDVPIPRPQGKWLGTPLASRGYDIAADQVLIHGILSLMIDEFYDRLAKVARTNKNVTVINLRGKVSEWNDELHPNRHGSQGLAREFVRVIDGA